MSVPVMPDFAVVRSVACVAVLAVSFASLCAQEPGGTQDPVAEKDAAPAAVSIPIPESWKVLKEIRSALGEEMQAYVVLDLHAAVPGVVEPLQIRVSVLNGTRVQPRHQAVYEVQRFSDTVRWNQGPVEMEPIPHVVYEDKLWTRMISVQAYRRLRGRGVHVDVYLEKKDWAGLRAQWFDVLQEVTANFAWWPMRPDDGKLAVVDGIAYAKAGNVAVRDLKEIQRFIARARKRFEKVYGPIWTAPEEPLLIYVNGTPGGHEAILGWNTTADVVGQSLRNRIVTVPLGERGSAVSHSLMGDVVSLWIRHLHGHGVESWLSIGEARVAQEWSRLGRELPYATAGFIRDVTGVRTSLEAVSKMAANDAIRAENAAAYVAFFRDGPDEYRAVYEEFLAEALASGDTAKALATHLLALDQTELLEAVQEFAKKLRPAKPR